KPWPRAGKPLTASRQWGSMARVSEDHALKSRRHGTGSIAATRTRYLLHPGPEEHAVDYPDSLKERYVPLEAITFDIRREGRSWSGDEFEKSYFAMPEKMEATDGKLYWDDDDRLKVLGALLEN